MKKEDIYQLIAGKKITTDTRNISEGSVFFALKGDNYNANTFAQEAIDKGAVFAIIDDDLYNTSSQTILVDDVLKTLQEIATLHRKTLGIPIIGITGSNGKTTTKELIGAVLSQKYKTVYTKGNLNNHIGVPLTLLSMTSETEIGVVEMGANHQGEIAFLADIAQPDFGFITNFGKAHLEGFGGVEGVIKGKSELYQHLKKHHKTAFVNAQDAIQMERTKGLQTIEFNKGEIILKKSNPFVEIAFDKQIIKSQLTGSYNFNNMAAAIAIGHYFEVSTLKIKEAIEAYQPQNNRSQIINKGNLQIVLDAYNANPTSMALSIQNVLQLSNKPKYFVLGDMFELGETSTEEHQAIVDLLENAVFEKAFLIGKTFNKTKILKSNINSFEDFETFKKHFKAPKLGAMLIKASRGMALERVLDLIQ